MVSSESPNTIAQAAVHGNKGFKDGNKGLEHGNKGLEHGNKCLEDGNKGLEDGNKGLEDGNNGFEDGNKPMREFPEALLQRLCGLPPLSKFRHFLLHFKHALHLPSHFVKLLDQVVHVLHRGTGAFGDPLSA